MKIRWMGSAPPETCRPLTCDRPVSVLPLAGMTLAARRAAHAAAAGFTIEEPHGNNPCWTLHDDAWLTPDQWRQLASCRSATVLKTGAGDTLGWWGAPDTPPANAGIMVSDEASRLIRYPWDVLALHEETVNGQSETVIAGQAAEGIYVDGTLVLGESSRILPGVAVEGCVIIGENCKIGPNCYLRGATSIGDHCHIGQAVEIKNSLIMDHTSIGHLSYVGDSILAEHVNFGGGTITANLRHDGKSQNSYVDGARIATGRRKFGAIIGAGVHTGIHTSIYPGRKIWPGCSTLPGQVVARDIIGDAGP